MAHQSVELVKRFSDAIFEDVDRGVQAEEVIARIEGLIDPEIEVVNPPEAQTMGFALTLTC